MWIERAACTRPWAGPQCWEEEEPGLWAFSQHVRPLLTPQYNAKPHILFLPHDPHCIISLCSRAQWRAIHLCFQQERIKANPPSRMTLMTNSSRLELPAYSRGDGDSASSLALSADLDMGRSFGIDLRLSIKNRFLLSLVCIHSRNARQSWSWLDQLCSCLSTQNIVHSQTQRDRAVQGAASAVYQSQAWEHFHSPGPRSDSLLVTP